MHRKTCNVKTHCPCIPQAVLGVATFLGELNESGGILISALQCKGQVWADLEGTVAVESHSKCSCAEVLIHPTQGRT